MFIHCIGEAFNYLALYKSQLGFLVGLFARYVDGLSASRRAGQLASHGSARASIHGLRLNHNHLRFIYVTHGFPALVLPSELRGS